MEVGGLTGDFRSPSTLKAGNNQMAAGDVKKGPWTEEEDAVLINYVRIHGEGRWNSVAHLAGLRRTGKSCRLRWLNYLKPDLRRGNITLEEQLTILDLHLQWGNRWSKIAKYLPGRTDNEIKNYWRTRVQKQAKQLKCDVNSKQFRDALRHVWIPRMIERIRASSGQTATTGQYPDYSMTSYVRTVPEVSISTTSSTTSDSSSECYKPINDVDFPTQMDPCCPDSGSGRFSDQVQVAGSGTDLSMDGASDNMWSLDGGDDDLQSVLWDNIWSQENIGFLHGQLYGEDFM
ncbi:hypothetical protein SAY87_006654 [Trapa incisa]|uniref:Uncharacterized protein n=1 Tax=Trapa incisa TaxID=236973 RepID=A0AAN7PYS3_9MYRT|nr:hypothetical protein SAY87_006654 [Trapa incisa]